MRLLMTDTRFLEDLRARVTENPTLERELEKYNGLEGYLSILSSSGGEREDMSKAATLMMGGTLQHLLVAKTLLNEISVEQNDISDRVDKVKAALDSEVMPKLRELERASEKALDEAKAKADQVKN